MEILYQQPIMEIEPSYGRLIGKLFIAFMIGVVAWIICETIDGGVSAIITGIIDLLLLLALLLTAIFAPMVETGRYEYTAVIDEETPFVEIAEKYEIVNTQGRVWTLRDKEIEE